MSRRDSSPWATDSDWPRIDYVPWTAAERVVLAALILLTLTIVGALASA